MADEKDPFDEPAPPADPAVLKLFGFTNTGEPDSTQSQLARHEERLERVEMTLQAAHAQDQLGTVLARRRAATAIAIGGGLLILATLIGEMLTFDVELFKALSGSSENASPPADVWLARVFLAAKGVVAAVSILVGLKLVGMYESLTNVQRQPSAPDPAGAGGSLDRIIALLPDFLEKQLRK